MLVGLRIQQCPCVEVAFGVGAHTCCFYPGPFFRVLTALCVRSNLLAVSAPCSSHSWGGSRRGHVILVWRILKTLCWYLLHAWGLAQQPSGKATCSQTRSCSSLLFLLLAGAVVCMQAKGIASSDSDSFAYEECYKKVFLQYDRGTASGREEGGWRVSSLLFVPLTDMDKKLTESEFEQFCAVRTLQRR